MLTYIIKSGNWHKIGKTENMEYRLSCYATHNPSFELVHVIEFDCERFLQKRFEDKRFKLAWFNLTEEDIKWIRDNHETLSMNTLDILKQKDVEENNKRKEEIRKRRREKKRITYEQSILRRQLQDKEDEEWLLRKIKEEPSRFS